MLCLIRQKKMRGESVEVRGVLRECVSVCFLACHVKSLACCLQMSGDGTSEEEAHTVRVTQSCSYNRLALTH